MWITLRCLSFNGERSSVDVDAGWRGARSTRMGRRYMSRSNSLLHVRCLGIQRRKASYLNRISYGRKLQSQMRSVANRMPTVAVDAASTSVPQSSHDSGQKPGDQVGIVSSNTWRLIANFFSKSMVTVSSSAYGTVRIPLQTSTSDYGHLSST